jgi:hypothetical protein
VRGVVGRPASPESLAAKKNPRQWAPLQVVEAGAAGAVAAMGEDIVVEAVAFAEDVEGVGVV